MPKSDSKPPNSSLASWARSKLPVLAPPPISRSVVPVWAWTVPVLLKTTWKEAVLPAPPDLVNVPALLKVPFALGKPKAAEAWASNVAPARLLKTAPLPLPMRPPVHVVVPALVRVRLSPWEKPPMMSVAVSAMWVAPVPLMFPPVQSSWPVTVRSPDPVRVPPLPRVKSLASESAPRARVPTDPMTRVSRLRSERTEARAEERVTVTSPGTSMSTASVSPGRRPLSQLAGSVQSPSPPIHWMVASSNSKGTTSSVSPMAFPARSVTWEALITRL